MPRILAAHNVQHANCTFAIILYYYKYLFPNAPICTVNSIRWT